MLSRTSRILFGIAALCLVGLYFVPLWNINLIAPQYPEGLGMRIWLDAITGLKPNDLESINNLNHYIGMKRIEPDSIPELRFMPLIVGALVATGAAVAVSGRRMLAKVWLGAFLLLAVAGLADFYRWGYDYGHDLDQENAIIKVPGMTYQPPLIGSKKLLNFTATSLPAAGTVIATVAFGLGVAALVVGVREAVQERHRDRLDAALVELAREPLDVVFVELYRHVAVGRCAGLLSRERPGEATRFASTKQPRPIEARPRVVLATRRDVAVTGDPSQRIALAQAREQAAQRPVLRRGEAMPAVAF